MTTAARTLASFLSLILLASSSIAQPASISAELAKKCRQLAIKAHPTPVPGTRSTGAGKAQRDYFSTCIAKGGKMEDEQQQQQH